MAEGDGEDTASANAGLVGGPLGARLRAVGVAPGRISGAAEDSRRVRPGGLFFALPGGAGHGLRFAAEAKARGAVAVVSDRPGPAAGLPVLPVADPRAELARLCRMFAGPLPPVRVAVTGTRGKSSALAYWRQLLALAGVRAGTVGSLGRQVGAAEGNRRPVVGAGYEFTTPPVSLLYEGLRELREAGCSHVGVEASSQGLAQRRLEGLEPVAAGWTDFSPAHREFHGTVSAYFAAKRKLPEEILAPGSSVVVGRAFPGWNRLAEVCSRRGHRLVRADRGTGSFWLRGASERWDGLRLFVRAGGDEREVDVPLLGRWQALNLAVAVHLALPLIEASAEDVLGLLPKLRSPAGRMEKLAEGPGGRMIFSDYCSQPEAYAEALRFARRLARRSLLVVFGCDGERDPRLRPRIGRIVAGAADEVWLADLNPGREDPGKIRRHALAGAGAASRRWNVVPDRTEAIRRAIRAAVAGDVVLLAGKGHERLDAREDGPVAAGDREAVEAALAGNSGGWRIL